MSEKEILIKNLNRPGRFLGVFPLSASTPVVHIRNIASKRASLRRKDRLLFLCLTNENVYYVRANATTIRRAHCQISLKFQYGKLYSRKRKFAEN